MRHSLLSLFVLVVSSLSAQSFRDFNYEISCVGIGQYGYYLVEVSTFVNKKKDVGHDVVKRSALHGILYKGFSATNEYPAQKPILSSSLSAQQQDYLINLVKNQYALYTSSVDEMLKVVKVGKRYKVTAIIEVNVAQLRKTLEKEGVVRKLGF